jgi:single-strand DNA-binding protein
MQSYIAIGRMVRDADIHTTASGIKMARFTLAIQRTKDKVDFINFLAWRTRAEILEKYCKKGSQIAIQCELQSSEYEKDGEKKYKTEVVVNQIKLLGSKKQEETQTTDDDLPF